MDTNIPRTVPRKSATFDDYTLAEIRRAATTGIYDIRGAGAARRLRPAFHGLVDIERALGAEELAQARRLDLRLPGDIGLGHQDSERIDALPDLGGIVGGEREARHPGQQRGNARSVHGQRPVAKCVQQLDAHRLAEHAEAARDQLDERLAREP